MGTAWLANKVGQCGTVLEPGHIMRSGSFARPVWADKADTRHADFSQLGSVAVQLSERVMPI
jgi:2-oxo-hept-3-ene-1,7-dioate hydratase